MAISRKRVAVVTSLELARIACATAAKARTARKTRQAREESAPASRERYSDLCTCASRGAPVPCRSYDKNGMMGGQSSMGLYNVQAPPSMIRRGREEQAAEVPALHSLSFPFFLSSMNGQSALNMPRKTCSEEKKHFQKIGSHFSGPHQPRPKKFLQRGR